VNQEVFYAMKNYLKIF